MNPGRRTLTLRLPLALLLAAAPAFAAPPAPAPQSPAARPIQVASGKLLGVLTPDEKVIAYKGIPYAQPPTGDLRWSPPQPAAKWKQVLSASDFGHHCIQFGSYPDMVFHDPGPSEDCLTLNVWTPFDQAPEPQRQPHSKSPGLPVMVWIYGGGFSTGGTSENRQDGEFLAHRGVIVVSMNYRLGLFGFLAHPELTAESPHHASGNYGFMDQAAAIAWVRRNIRAFGGDPANITVFGQSAGSISVSTLMVSPLSKDLFAKAIGESGAALGSRGYQSREAAERQGAAWAERIGSSKLADLRSLSTDDLLKALQSHSSYFGPIVDGYVLPDTVPHLFAAGQQAHIPLLAGWVADEGRAVPPPTAEGFTTQAHTWFGPKAADFLAAYSATTDAEAAASAGAFATDQGMGFDTWSWLEAQTHISSPTGSAPVYRYLFALRNPGDRNHTPDLGAFHSDDIEYVFGALDSRPEMAIRPQDRTLSDQMQQYWTNFAKTGDPNGSVPNPDLPRWPVYNAADGYQFMRLDAPSKAAPDLHRARYLFLDRLRSTPAPAK